MLYFVIFIFFWKKLNLATCLFESVLADEKVHGEPAVNQQRPGLGSSSSLSESSSDSSSDSSDSSDSESGWVRVSSSRERERETPQNPDFRGIQNLLLKQIWLNKLLCGLVFRIRKQLCFIKNFKSVPIWREILFDHWLFFYVFMIKIFDCCL